MKEKANKNKDRKKQGDNTSYSETVRDTLFCCAIK